MDIPLPYALAKNSLNDLRTIRSRVDQIHRRSMAHGLGVFVSEIFNANEAGGIFFFQIMGHEIHLNSFLTFRLQTIARAFLRFKVQGRAIFDPISVHNLCVCTPKPGD